ncbi:conserved hypothetical protein [Desulfosarcina cetonica]|uniref:hypothetical protein n=1 Tax=Desulfosarcina cetonica TaxID=90730 RepID=UPI0006CF9B80|nr:hypothetical protein [Desulfosarcina cetonica]VTR69852.1 conserved hypothetical protein [Desulfosarcina cetonica]
MQIKPVIGDWEIPHIAWLQSVEKRHFAEIPIPGMQGSLFQDLNGAPLSLVIAGSLYGDEKRNEFLEAVREKFNAGEAMTFAADIVTATELSHVVIEQMRFEESARSPDETYYVLVIRESPPPPPPPSGLGGIDAGLLDDAAGLIDSVAGALDTLDALGSIPDFGNPLPPLQSGLDEFSSAAADLAAPISALGGIFGIDPTAEDD